MPGATFTSPPGRANAFTDSFSESGVVVAVASNIAHANTTALALKVADVFAEQK